jgi:predicted ArsR family transcriptional regulator
MPRLEGKSLDQRLALLKDYYLPGDPFITIERNGKISLVEHNCPYFNVAMARPAMCSITVNALNSRTATAAANSGSIPINRSTRKRTRSRWK